MLASTTLKRFAPVALVVGLVALLVAGGIAFVQKNFNVYVQVSLVVGLLGLALAVLFDPAAVLHFFGTRQMRYGSLSGVSILAFIACVVMLNYIVINNPFKAVKTTWDWTADMQNTLAPETINALGELTQTVKIIGFYSSDQYSAQQSAAKLLERYRVASSNQVTYEFHDPYNEPVLARTYNVTSQDLGTLVALLGEQKETLTTASEDELTGAIVRLMHPTSRVIYFVDNHGEKTFDNLENSLRSVGETLTKENYDLRNLNLAITTTVPADARVVVIAGPTAAFLPDEINTIDQYLQKGGSLIVMLDPPTAPDQPDLLADYLSAKWGVYLPVNYIVDYNNSQGTHSLFPISQNYGASPITRKMNAQTGVVFAIARSVEISGTAATHPEVTYTPLVTTSYQAWGETDLTNSQPAQDASDFAAPLNLAITAEKPISGSVPARLVIMGDSDFASDTSIGSGMTMVQMGENKALFVNSLNWATTDESLISLTPYTPTTRTLRLTELTSVTSQLLCLVTVVLMPGAVIVAGVMVWFLRRRHA